VNPDTVRHALSVAVRIDDHFIAAPVEDELDVRLDSILPAAIRGGGGKRHSDGTYRFVDVADGAHQIRIAANPNWMLLEPLPSIPIPYGPVSTALVISAWPSPARAVPAGLTAVRGKLLGTPTATIGRRIEFSVGGSDAGHHTQTDSLGECVFLFPGDLKLDADRMVALVLRVPGLTVVGGEVVTGDSSVGFTGAAFRIVPGRETRVRFHVT